MVWRHVTMDTTSYSSKQSLTGTYLTKSSSGYLLTQMWQFRSWFVCLLRDVNCGAAVFGSVRTLDGPLRITKWLDDVSVGSIRDMGNFLCERFPFRCLKWLKWIV